MKKILIIATTSYAGMGPYVVNIVNNFLQSDPVFFFFQDDTNDYFRKNIKTELQSKCVFCRRSNSNLHKLHDLLTTKYTFEDVILEICKKEDISLVHSINGPVRKSLLQRFDQMNIKVLGTVHDLHPHEAKKAVCKMLRQKILYERINKDTAINPFLVTNSKNQEEELHSQYPYKCIFFHDFPSLVTKTISTGKEIPKELRCINKPYILFFGRIEKYKGVELLYKAFLENKNLSDNFFLVIAGKGDLTFNRIEEEKNVIFIHRYIDDSEIRSLYKNASCVVYPYISATQSGVLSLAYYFETPVLTSDVPFFRSILSSSGAGVLFQNGNIKDLQKQLSYILHLNPQSIKEKESDYYQKYFQGRTIREQILNIYISILRIDEKQMCPK